MHVSHSHHSHHTKTLPAHHLRHPFMEFIIPKPIPHSYRVPIHLKLYDGIGDPRSHVDAFQKTMLVSSDSDVMQCKAFSVMLSEAAQQWFLSLPSWPVKDLMELIKKIFNHFIASWAHRKMSGSLYILNSGDNESLKDFISRLNDHPDKESKSRGGTIHVYKSTKARVICRVSRYIIS